MNAVCENCNALSFLNEHFNCCHSRKVHLDEYPFPGELQQLFQSDTECAKNFRSNIRHYNTAFSFSSMTAMIDTPPGRGPPIFRICGQMYHNYASLYPKANKPPSFAQLYIYQPSEANEFRLLNPVTGGCRPDVMEIISQVLHDRNPYARSYCTMHEIERRERERAREKGDVEVALVTMHMRTGPDRRCYNEPLADKVAAIFT